MASVEAVFNHLVLPPKLPDRQDADIRAVEDQILSRLVKTCSDLRLKADEETGIAVNNLFHSFEICGHINQERLEKTHLLAALRALRPEHVVIVYLVEQNAAHLIYRNDR
jgi:hypothetical protein